MLKSAVITLIREVPAAHGVGTEPEEIRREVYCTLKSIGMQEAYQAMGIGLSPELKAVLAHDFEYMGEPIVELNGVRFRILRTYIQEADGIELTLVRENGNARGTVVNEHAD